MSDNIPGPASYQVSVPSGAANRFKVNQEEDEFQAQLGRDNQQNPVFNGPTLAKPDYANFGDYTNPFSNPGDSANPTPYAKDSAADRQTVKLADAYAKEHGLSAEGHATVHDINQMDKQTTAQAGLMDRTNSNPETVNQGSNRTQMADVDPKGFKKSQQYAEAYLKEQKTGHQVYVGEAAQKQQPATKTYDPQTLTGHGLNQNVQSNAQHDQQNQAGIGNQTQSQSTATNQNQAQPQLTERTNSSTQANPKMNTQTISNTNSKTDYGLEQQAGQSDTKGQILSQLVNATTPQNQDQNQNNGPVI